MNGWKMSLMNGWKMSLMNEIMMFLTNVREVPLSHPVKSANFRFFTFDLRQIRLKEQCVLIYA